MAVSAQSHASFAAIPDFIVYRNLTSNWPVSNWYSLPPDKIPIWFGVDVKGIRFLRDNPLSFAIPESSVNGMIAFASTHHMWGVFARVPWDAANIRIITPVEARACPPDRYGNRIVDGWKYPTLYQWLAEFPPYVGGQLARKWYPEQPAIPPAPPPPAPLPPAPPQPTY